jgi:hypothetical protein
VGSQEVEVEVWVVALGEVVVWVVTLGEVEATLATGTAVVSGTVERLVK